MSGAENRSWKQTRVWESEDTHEADSETQKNNDQKHLQATREYGKRLRHMIA